VLLDPGARLDTLNEALAGLRPSNPAGLGEDGQVTVVQAAA
jgi:hypothetical protein